MRILLAATAVGGCDLKLQLLLCSSSFYAAELENKLHLTFSTSAVRIWGAHLAAYKVFSEVFEEKAG